MSAEKVLGSSDPVITSVKKKKVGKDAAVFEVEGPYSLIESATPSSYVEDGYEVEDATVASTGDGMGKMTIQGVKYDDPSGSGMSAIRMTFRIEMKEVQYDLEDHPYLKGNPHDLCVKWLSTDASKRLKDEKYYYVDESDTKHEITDERAKKFCAAYMAGIKSYLRFYPVIEKISIWKNPPGMTMSGRSFTGGSLGYSAFDCPGDFEEPPITLHGFSNSNYFKSKDSWTENGNKTWTRTEQWTFTPDGSSGDHAWIYNEL